MPLRIPHLQFSVSGQMARNKTVNNHWTLYLDILFAEYSFGGTAAFRRGGASVCYMTY